jgi:hypothetical protein
VPRFGIRRRLAKHGAGGFAAALMSERIVCKPTPWFLLRAAAMLLMFGIFAVLFYQDGSTGYREKNLSFHIKKAVEAAVADFGDAKSRMSADEWREYAAKQRVFPPETDPSTLPQGTDVGMSWPALLGDYPAMEAGMSNWQTQLFDKYRDQAGLKKSPPEQPYSAKKIFEQWVVFWICLALFLATLFVLLRTLSRKMVLEGTTFQPAGGPAVELSDLKRLDLRRWQGKGLAFAWADNGKGGERKIRIDGLTYGGFKAEDDQPAERLMKGLRAGFSGELIDYDEPTADEPAAAGGDGASTPPEERT